MALRLRSLRLWVHPEGHPPVVDRDEQFEVGDKFDSLAQRAIVGVKAFGSLGPIEYFQLMSCLKHSSVRLGRLVTFHVLRRKVGIK
ncbi:MAG: GxxExxY protein [Planctomycetaceae bacterium]